MIKLLISNIAYTADPHLIFSKSIVTSPLTSSPIIMFLLTRLAKSFKADLIFILFNLRLTSEVSNFFISKFLSNNFNDFFDGSLPPVKEILLTKFSSFLFLFNISDVSLLNSCDVFLKFSALAFTLKDSIS